MGIVHNFQPSCVVLDMADITEVSVSVAKLEVQVERLESDMHEMKDDIKFIRKKLDEAAGGWKVLMIVGGLGAALGGFLFKILDMVGR